MVISPGCPLSLNIKNKRPPVEVRFPSETVPRATLYSELSILIDNGTATTGSPVPYFKVGSSVVVVGRTSQRTDDEGALESCTINVTGLLVTDNRGKSMDTVEIPVEEDTDWF